MNKSPVLYNDAEFEKWMKDCDLWEKSYKPRKDLGDFPSSGQYPLIAVGNDFYDNSYGRYKLVLEYVELRDFNYTPLYKTELGIFTHLHEAKQELEYRDLTSEVTMVILGDAPDAII